MRVGVVTLFGDNIGNKLQNYALLSLIREQGHAVETIRVQNGTDLPHAETKKEFLKKFRLKRRLMSFQESFKYRYDRKNQRDGYLRSVNWGRHHNREELKAQRREAFSAFSEAYLSVSKAMLDGDRDNRSVSRAYDCFVCGSDQVWNRTKGVYFLNFAEEKKRVAFAASFGISELPEYLRIAYKKWLEGIPYLSVREEAGAAIIRELTGREAPVLPDPTLCLTAEQWKTIERKPDFAEGQYVLTYFLGNETNQYRRYIEAYAKAHSASIVNLLDLREPEYYAADPAEFVWLVRHARAMFTDSFHGTVFSLLFHTPFVVFDRMESGGTSMGSRLETLLRMTDMENRRFGQVAVSAVEDIGFAASDEAIAERAAEARAFLQRALDGVAASKDEPEPVLGTVLPDKADCSGCGACRAVCPVRCIRMETDGEGFRYPVINPEACIRCDRCRGVCIDAAREKTDGAADAYIAHSRDAELRAGSSSGGAFTALARQVLLQGGCVYGAGFDDDFRVVHQCAKTEEQMKNLRGSKYVQSDMTPVFEEIRDRLQDGAYVYFSGTPCQVDALLAFLGRDYEKLITQDIICHGVPSPAVWQAYLAMRSGERTVRHVSFRDKTYGWHYFSMRIDTDNGRYVNRLDEDVYTRLFLDNVILRPSCYACRHKHLNRKSDITLGDCWSLGSLQADVKDDDRGLSLLFANSEKGKRLLEEAKDSLVITPVDFEQAANSQTAMTRSVPFNPQRELFFTNANALGMERTIREWYGWTLPNDVKRSIVYLKTQLRKLIR